MRRVLRIIVIGPFVLAAMLIITLGLLPALAVMWLIGVRPDLEDLAGPYEGMADIVWNGID